MEFCSRHMERDMALVNKREMLLSNAVEDLSGDPYVLGIYLAGSLAKGNADSYSDIDLHTIVKPEKKMEFLHNKCQRPAKWGDVLFYEDFASDSPVIYCTF